MSEIESGSIPYEAGLGALLRIPVPDSGGLALELKPRGHVPAGGSTSSVFIQDKTGRRVLRLDYGYNKRTGSFDYHWNQKGTFAEFGISDHQTSGRGSGTTYQAARVFRHLGKAFVVIGLTLDAVSVVTASEPMKRSSEVVAGWAGATLGCKVVGGQGAKLGSKIKKGHGTAVGAIGGCIVGSVSGGFAGQKTGRVVYEWSETTVFSPVPLTPLSE